MKRIVIIGGGPAGLTAAYELLSKRGNEVFDVTVLEAGDCLGGISRTVTHGGCRMDLGGHRFFSKDERVMAWWSSFMPVQGKPSMDDRLLRRSKPLIPGGGDPEREDNVMLVRNRISRIYYRGRFFDYPVKPSPATFRSLGAAATLRAAASYIRSALHKLPETNLENFYINRFGRVLYSTFFEGYTEKLWGRHPRDISADWGAQRVKGLSVTAVVKDMAKKLLGLKNNGNSETSLIEQFWYPKYGPGQMWELVGDKVRELGGKIRFGCAVESVQTDGGKVVSVTCSNGEIFAGDEFISSMPIKELVCGMDAPAEVRAVARALPYRDFVTVGLLVNKLRLRNKTKIPTLGDIVPDCWIYVQDRGVRLGRIQIFNNWSPYLVEDPRNTVWIGLEYFCSEGDGLWSMTDEQLVRFAARELRKMGIIGKRSVLDSHVERVKKAYPAYFDSYREFGCVREYLDGFENLRCVGRNGQHRYNNMDHSMLTAMLAADAIKNGIKDRSAIWGVNTEKAYHEQK